MPKFMDKVFQSSATDLPTLKEHLRKQSRNIWQDLQLLENSIQTNNGQVETLFSFANGRFKTDADGNVWLQLKASDTGLYHTIFVQGGLLSSEKDGEQ